MAPKNDYLKKKEKHEHDLIEAGIKCGKQQIVDYLTLVLHDPLYVDKDIFGVGRIEKVLVGLEAYDEMFKDAYTVHKEADYYQEKLDERLRDVVGDRLIPFKERQPDIFQPKYNKRKKGWVD